MALKDDKTLLTKGDLKKFYNKILPYMGGNYVFNTLGVKDYYSEDEKVIGVYIDGRPLYRKGYTNITITVSGGKQQVIDSNITVANGYLVNKFYGSFIDPSNIVINPLPCPTSANGNAINVALGINNKGLILGNSYDNFIGRTATVFIEYTKATDAPNSAVNTIGCYDITRPDLWPENKEITFGNGLYGQRFVGTYTPVACSSTTGTEPSGQVDTVLLTGVDHTQSIGGYAKGYNSETKFPISTSNNNNANGIFLYVTSSGNLTLRSVCWRELKSSNIKDKEYDIWVTYKKK